MFPNSASIRLTLLNITPSTDNIGNKTFGVKSSKEVIGISKSITSNEYLSQTKIDVVFEFKISILCFLYDGSKYIKTNNIIYKIERTYINGMYIELYLVSTELELDI